MWLNLIKLSKDFLGLSLQLLFFVFDHQKVDFRLIQHMCLIYYLIFRFSDTLKCINDELLKFVAQIKILETRDEINLNSQEFMQSL